MTSARDLRTWKQKVDCRAPLVTGWESQGSMSASGTEMARRVFHNRRRPQTDKDYDNSRNKGVHCVVHERNLRSPKPGRIQMNYQSGEQPNKSKKAVSLWASDTNQSRQAQRHGGASFYRLPFPSADSKAKTTETCSNRIRPSCGVTPSAHKPSAGWSTFPALRVWGSLIAGIAVAQERYMQIPKKDIRLRTIAAVALMLAGCAVQGPDYQRVAPVPDKAAIYVYRTYPTAGFGAGAQVIINCGDNAVGLGPGGYHQFTVPPGKILCSSHSENTAQIELDAQPGRDYYLRQSLSMGVLQPRVSLEAVDAEVAQADIQTCKRQ